MVRGVPRDELDQLVGGVPRAVLLAADVVEQDRERERPLPTVAEDVARQRDDVVEGCLLYTSRCV